MCWWESKEKEIFHTSSSSFFIVGNIKFYWIAHREEENKFTCRKRFTFCILSHFFFSSTDASKGLRNLTLSVYPEVIRRGQSAQLHCNYEVFDVPLYSVKWYRGIFEFYRYTPFEHPPGKTFFFNTGIKVDVSILVWITNGYPHFFFDYMLHFFHCWLFEFASFNNKNYLYRKFDSENM